MTEESERKSWHAIAQEASVFYIDHGGESMSLDAKAQYAYLLQEVEEAAKRHDEARD